MKSKFVILILTFCAFTSYAQLSGEDTNLQSEGQDTIGAPIERNALQSFKLIFSGKPGKVALVGLLVPGGGQIYNKDYWKAPIIWAADAGSVYYFLYWRGIYKEFQRAHADLLLGSILEYRGIADEPTLRRYRNQYRLNMERAGFLMVGVHLLGVIEAFTASHLKDFDVSEELSFEFKMETQDIQLTSIPSFGFRYQF